MREAAGVDSGARDELLYDIVSDSDGFPVKFGLAHATGREGGGGREALPLTQGLRGKEGGEERLLVAGGGMPERPFFSATGREGGAEKEGGHRESVRR